MRSRFVCLLLSLAGVSACSWSYGADLQSTSQGLAMNFVEPGSFAFVPDSARVLCTTSVAVRHGSGEDVWRIAMPEDSDEGACVDIGGVVYGQVPAGFVEIVPAERLEPGQAYELTFASLGDYPNAGRTAFCLTTEGEPVKAGSTPHYACP